MKKKLLSVLLLAAMLMTAMPSFVFAEGANTEAPSEATEAVSISTVDELKSFAAAVNAGDTFANKTVKLENDITFGEEDYLYYDDGTSIVDYRITKPFAGTFDGQGFSIFGLKFHNSDPSKSPYMYLFNTISGTVQNLTLDGVTADVNNDDRFGFLAYTLKGTATNCHVKNVTATVSVDSTGEGYTSTSGGMFSSINSATVSGCTAETVKITCYGKDNTDHVGALIGSAGGSAEARSTVENCSVSDITFDCTRKTKRTGGFVGSATYTDFTDCTASNITLNIEQYYQSVGGFVGSSGSGTSFTRCKVIGFTMKDSGGNIGGEVGGFVCWAVSTTFTDCSVSELNIDLAIDDTQGWGIGGFAASMEGGSLTLSNCSASGEISVGGTSENNKVGGLIGTLYADNMTIEITNSNTNVDIAANGLAGSFIGNTSTKNNTLTADTCTASGNVSSASGVAGGFVAVGSCGEFTNCTTSSNVSGATAGGFWGEITPNTNGLGVSVDSCEATGTVVGENVASGFVGSITASGENDTNATNVTIQNSVPATVDKENSGANAEIVDFAKETVPDGSNSHLTSAGNSANPYGFGAKVAIFRWFDEAEQKYKLWMCAGIDSLEYKEVGFIVTTGDGQTETYTITKVYNSIVDSTGTRYTAEAFETEFYNAGSIFAQGLSFTEDYAKSTSITYKPFAVKLDGTVIYGSEFTRDTIYKA